MRSALVVLVVLFMLPSSALPQVSDVEEGVTFEALPHLWRQVLTNRSSRSLVAFQAWFHCPGGGPVVADDSFLYSGNRDVSPGKSVEITVGDPSRCSGHVDAAIFSDGHVEGDPMALDRLYWARRGAYQALGNSIKLLNTVSDHESVEHVIDTLTARKQAALNDHTASGAGYRLVLSVTLEALTNHQGVNTALPSDNRGQKPPTVEDVMNATGLTRDEARAVVLGKRLEAWKSLLENNLRLSQ